MRDVARLRAASSPTGRLVALLLLWVAAAGGSKLAVPEPVHLVLGDAVVLGGFVTVLVVALLLVRTGVRRLLATGNDPMATAVVAM